MRTLLLSLALLAACNGEGDAPDDTVDADNDGFSEADDCDDSNADVNPDATEVCNGVDDDCNDAVDDNASDATASYEDADADGFGGSTTMMACEIPAGFVSADGDCDDSDADINPGADELCDAADRDCDGSATNGSTDATVFYADTDNDAFGDPNVSQNACSAPSGFVADDTDCDDTDADIHPNTEWYPDMDRDGFGNRADSPTLSCEQPVSSSRDNTDCNDLNNQINPGEQEVCDNADNDCDGFEDDLFCPTYDGTWEGDFQLGAVEAAGSIVVNNMQCTGGSMTLVVDRSADPVVQGTSTCTYSGGLGGFSRTQTGVFTGEMGVDGVVRGRYEHDYGSNPSDTYDFEADIGGDGALVGDGGYRPSSFSAVDWQVDFSSSLD